MLRARLFSSPTETKSVQASVPTNTWRESIGIRLKQTYQSVSQTCSKISFSPRNVPGNLKYTFKCLQYAVVFIATLPAAQAETCFKENDHKYKLISDYEGQIITALQNNGVPITDVISAGKVTDRTNCADFFTNVMTWGAGYFGFGSKAELSYHNYDELDPRIPSTIASVIPEGVYGNGYDIAITIGICLGGACALSCLSLLAACCAGKKQNDDSGYFLMEEGGAKKKWQGFVDFFKPKPKPKPLCSDECCAIAVGCVVQ